MRKKNWKIWGIMIIALILSLSLIGCKSGQDEEVEVEEESKSGENEGVVEEIVDENTGLVYEGKLELKYAEHFAVDYYKDGYKIIRDASDRRILVVPEGKEVPEMKESMPVLQQPIDSFAVYSTIEPAWFRPIDEIDRIVAVTFEEEKWKTDDMIDRVKSGDVTFIGNSRDVDYELLQAVNPDLNLLSKSNEEKVFPKYDELKLPYISMASYMESDPRGRLEWTKLIAVLLNKEEMAENFFQEELARIDAVAQKIQDKIEDKPKVTMVYFAGSSQEFKVTNIEGYKVKNMEMAGASYYPADLGLDKRGSTAMTPEEFYKTMSQTDIMIYDSASGHEIQSIGDMLDRADYLADTKIFQEGRIWGLKRDFWQAGEKVAAMTEEYYEIFYTPHGEIEETDYFYLMK